MSPPADVLVFGPHPDDVELFCGGAILRAVDQGQRVVVADLTAGERASRGTPELRAQEASRAAEVLGLAERENLELPDLALNASDETQLAVVTECIRRHRPRLVWSPPPKARHPDHFAAHHLVRDAVFRAGVGGWKSASPRHRVEFWCAYLMRVELRPSFLLNTSGTAERKRRAIECYASQLSTGSGPQTLLARSGSLAAIEARDRYFGACLAVETAEPMWCEGLLGFDQAAPSFSGPIRGPGFFMTGGGA
ncbi:MAG: bacillithiol biosynthesis deacetylase BshB1 [Myxococcota bacterium]